MAKKFDLQIFMASVRHEAGEKNNAGLTTGKLLNLLKLENENFIRAAYYAFFNREPDPSGMATYLPFARDVPRRIQLLLILSLAPERKYLPLWQRRIADKFLRIVDKFL